jgi:hypothetical protein
LYVYTYVDAGHDAPLTKRGIRWLTVIATVLAVLAVIAWFFALRA